MGTLHFSLYMLKKEYKKCLFYMITLSLSIAVVFFFFNIFYNRYLEVSGSQMVAFLIIVFTGVMIVFANNLYLSRKTNEMAIMAMSGASLVDTTLYLFYQNFMMTLLTLPVGYVLGVLLSLGANQIIYQYLSLSLYLFYLPIPAFLDTLLCVLSILLAQLMYASGYVYRKDITYLLTQHDTQMVKDYRIVKLPSIFYVLVYIFGIVILLTTPYSRTIAILPCCLGALSIGGMIKYYLPSLLKRLKERYLISHKVALIVISHLYYAMARSIVLIQSYAVAASVLISFMILAIGSPHEFIMIVVSFIVTLLLLFVSILYKYSVEASSRQIAFYNLHKLGYVYHELKMIIRNEIIAYYSMLLLLPMVYMIISLVIVYLHHDLSLFMCLMLIMFQIGLASLSAVVTYFLYKKIVDRILKEGISYE